MFIVDDDFDRGALRSFSFGRNTKPILAVQRIMQALLPVSTPLELQPDNRFDFLMLKITRIYCFCSREPAWCAMMKIIWR